MRHGPLAFVLAVVVLAAGAGRAEDGRAQEGRLVLRGDRGTSGLSVTMSTEARRSPGAILGLTLDGVSFTPLSRRGAVDSRNRLRVELRSPVASRSTGSRPVVKLEPLRDTKLAVIARVEVENEGTLPVTYSRDLILVKGAYLISREELRFEADCEVRISAQWAAPSLRPKIGQHWGSVTTSAARRDGSSARDLLVYFAPQEGWRLEVVGSSRLRHSWAGTAKAGETFRSTQVFYPLREGEARSAASSANRIRMVRDESRGTLVRTTFPGLGVEWILFNPAGKDFYHETFETDARHVLIRTRNYFVDRYVIDEGSWLRWHGDDIVRFDKRRTDAREIENP